MRRNVLLTVRTRAGGGRRAVIDRKRFTIGRGPDDDLVVEGANVIRHHASINTVLGTARLHDGGAWPGTTLNGRRLGGPAQLRHGDIIGLAGSVDICVKFVPAALAPVLRLANVKSLVAASTAFIALVAVVFALMHGNKPRGGRDASIVQPAAENSPAEPAHAPDREGAGRAASPAGAQGVPQATPDDVQVTETKPQEGQAQQPEPADAERDEVGRAAVRVMRRISREDATYTLDERALESVRQQIERFKSSPRFGEELRAMSGGLDSVVLRSRKEGVEPALIVFATLALSEGDRRGLPRAGDALKVLSDLAGLSKTFGAAGADSSLIVLAAYSQGLGTKRTHPLLSNIRKLGVQAFSGRDVWTLREAGLIDDKAYDLVIKFIACGVISQNPKRFGVDAEPLNF